MGRLTATLRRAVLSTQHLPILCALYHAVYRAAARLSALTFRLLLGRRLKTLYLRRGLAAADGVPGASDIDLLLLLRADPEVPLLRRVWGLYGLLRRFFPMLGELQIATEEELAAWAAHGGSRRAELPHWKVLSGERATCTPSPGTALAHLQEAAAAYVFLAQTYFESARAPLAPDFGFRLRKGFLDVGRFSDAASLPGGELLSRRERLETARDRLDDDLAARLSSPLGLQREDGLRLVHAAMTRLDAAAAAVLDAPPQGPGRPTAIPRSSAPPLLAADDGWWRRTLSALEAPGIPAGTGFFLDTLFRWYVVLPSVPGPEDFGRTASLMDEWHRTESTFASPGWLLTRGILRMMTRTVHLDTPFFAHCLGDGYSQGLWLRAHSRFPLWEGHYRARWNLNTEESPPSLEDARAAARRAAADLALSLRFFGLGHWAGDRPYRLFFLLSRILGLRLFLEQGVVFDPQDIDSVLKAYRSAYPESGGWLRELEESCLSRTRAQLAARAPAELFYPYYPFLREALHAALFSAGRAKDRHAS